MAIYILNLIDAVCTLHIVHHALRRFNRMYGTESTDAVRPLYGGL